MSILDEVLKEEMERLKRIEVAYREEIDNLPKGYIMLKNINGKQYPYLQYRLADKIKSEYIKKHQLEKIQKDLARRKKLEQAIKRVNSEKKKIERVLNNGNKL